MNYQVVACMNCSKQYFAVEKHACLKFSTKRHHVSLIFFFVHHSYYKYYVFWLLYLYEWIDGSFSSSFSLAPGPPAPRRGHAGGHRGRGRYPIRREGPMKFEKDFDFESANAQFNKEEIDKEFQSKLKLKGTHI